MARAGRSQHRGRRRLRTALRWVGGLLLTLLIAAAALLFWSTRRPFPQIDGEMTLRGLGGEVEVIRDGDGVPHIYAADPRDLFMAQGFVHSQDRFWQMDTWRHIGAGRLAEMFGEGQVETDAFIRAMGWYRLAEAQLDRASSEEREWLEAYAAGVNAYLEQRSPAELGLEYTVLNAVNWSYEPEPWTPADTIVWGKVISWDLRSNIDDEIDRALMLSVMTPEELAVWYPGYPETAPLIVEGDGPRVSGPGIDPSPVEAGLAALRRTAGNADLIDAMTGGGGEGLGSNSWVVDGSRSATGAPILANDPHLGIRMPSIWYQVGLHCRPKGADCPFDVAGFSFAGAPGVVIGHNDRIAWGFTNLAPDVMDLYVERVNPENPDQYEVNGEWIDMEVHTETIRVAGGDDVDVVVRATRHGPVVSDVFGRLDDFSDSGLDLPDPYAVALRWTAFDDEPPLTRALFGLNAAQGWDEFRTALRTFTVPAQNVVYADVDGNIGYQTPGLIPIRASGDGRLPVAGWTDQHEWTGYLPFEELPFVFNPESGYLVTANNAVADGAYPHLITTDWNLGDRATRLVELLGDGGELSLNDMATFQGDTRNVTARRMTPVLLGAGTTGLSEAERAAVDLMEGWDGDNDADSSGAAVFEAVWRRFLLSTLEDDLPEDIEIEGGARWSLAMAALAGDPSNRFWDDRTTPEDEDLSDMVHAAWRLGVADLVELLGDDPGDWAWGDLHTATFRNETLGESGVGLVEAIFNRGPYTTSGGFDVVNATGWTPAAGFVVDWIPSMRMIVDLGDLSRSLAVNSTGQSGHAYHGHYTDQVDPWRLGAMLPFRWDRDQIEADAEGVLTLVP